MYIQGVHKVYLPQRARKRDTCLIDFEEKLFLDIFFLRGDTPSRAGRGRPQLQNLIWDDLSSDTFLERFCQEKLRSSLQQMVWNLQDV